MNLPITDVGKKPFPLQVVGITGAADRVEAFAVNIRRCRSSRCRHAFYPGLGTGGKGHRPESSQKSQNTVMELETVTRPTFLPGKTGGDCSDRACETSGAPAAATAAPPANREAVDDNTPRNMLQSKSPKVQARRESLQHSTA